MHDNIPITLCIITIVSVGRLWYNEIGGWYCCLPDGWGIVPKKIDR